MVVVGGDRGKKCCLMGTEFRFWEVESALRMDGGDGSRMI